MFVFLNLIGDDQCLLAKVAYGEKNDYVSRPLNTTRVKLWHIDEKDKRCGNLWFFYQRFFAKAKYYECPHDRLGLILENANT